MTPAELKAWRRVHGLSQTDLAELLGLQRNSVTRWEMGRHPIPTWLELALWAIEHGAPVA